MSRSTDIAETIDRILNDPDNIRSDPGNVALANSNELAAFVTYYAQVLRQPGSAAGDIFYYDGTSFQRLPKGTLNQVLTQGASAPYWAAGGGGGATITHFQARSSAGQAIGTTWADVTNWLAADVSNTDFSWNTGTGELTVNQTGLLEFGFQLAADSNSRCEMQVKALVNTGGGYADVPGALDNQYSSRNNTQDVGSAQFGMFKLQVSSGDVLKMQAQRVGSNVVTALYGRLSATLYR